MMKWLEPILNLIGKLKTSIIALLAYLKGKSEGRKIERLETEIRDYKNEKAYGKILAEAKVHKLEKRKKILDKWNRIRANGGLSNQPEATVQLSDEPGDELRLDRE